MLCINWCVLICYCVGTGVYGLNNKYTSTNVHPIGAKAVNNLRPTITSNFPRGVNLGLMHDVFVLFYSQTHYFDILGSYFSGIHNIDTKYLHGSGVVPNISKGLIGDEMLINFGK